MLYLLYIEFHAIPCKSACTLNVLPCENCAAIRCAHIMYAGIMPVVQEKVLRLFALGVHSGCGNMVCNRCVLVGEMR